MILSNIQLDIAKEIISIGLAKAADSMSFFVKKSIILKDFDVKVTNINNTKNLSNKKGSNINVLTTELKGEMGGICFLVIDKEDANVLYQTALPETILKEEQKLKAMAPELLKEVDNIVTAAVVTQLSNLLKYDIHGYVPIYDSVSEDKLDSFLRDNIKLEEHIFYIAVQFQVPNSLFCPEFIWALDSNFINGIKRFIDDPNNETVIKNMS